MTPIVTASSNHFENWPDRVGVDVAFLAASSGHSLFGMINVTDSNSSLRSKTSPFTCRLGVASSSWCSGPLARLQLSVHRRHVHHGTRGVIIGFPLICLGTVTDQGTLTRGQPEPAAVDRVKLVRLDEAPLLCETPCSNGRFLRRIFCAIPSGRSFPRPGSTRPLAVSNAPAGEGLSLVVETAVLFVPAPIQRVVNQPAGDFPGAVVVRRAQCVGCLESR